MRPQKVAKIDSFDSGKQVVENFLYRNADIFRPLPMATSSP